MRNHRQQASAQREEGRAELSQQATLNLLFSNNVRRFRAQGWPQARAEQLAREAEQLYLANLPQA
ncbi:hypothetical protein Deipr_2332 (plasmid) [Deinococcus proteolyticus MRP]|uniref:Uncharacterized protein n=1 Tax=Deinococcus proteolyticus (strain ATCC 35074 / DSM 20540 / JCM 6276 / NBRC 101906 / NCIMB 13154 / VKM Ac-1939 / CCM 2703 / MRP) TaxID=693977 RepID=F0RQ98_DEIPM|nr:hypothetical protein [Deinococcus proteolyticus]ADY27457.1 hypothetical protein Deipr_2332 [Deinococcus proteolyticus MRP]